MNEASRGLPANKRYILSSCLKCLGILVGYKPFVDQMGSFIDGHLAPVYQILESRLVPECDDDIIRIAAHFAKNSELPHESLLTAVGDMAGYFGELLLHSQEVLELVDECVGLLAGPLDGPQLLDEDSGRQLKANASSVWQLAKAMLSEAAKSSEEADGVDQIAINSAALACQLCVQALSPFLAAQVAEVEGVLELVGTLSERLRVSADSFLYSRLYGIYCSGFIYLPEITIGYLEKRQALDSFLKTLVARTNCFVTGYDRKLQILAVLAVFKVKLRAESLDATALACFDAAVLSLHVQRMEEDLKLSGQQKSLGREGKTEKSRHAPSEAERQDIAVYNLVKGKTYSLGQVLQEEVETKAESEEILEFLMGADREARKSLASIKSKVMEVDEFREFVQTFADLKAFFRERLNEVLLDKLSSAAKLVLPGVLQCQKVATVVNEKQHDVDALPRKIVKVKARPPAQ